MRKEKLVAYTILFLMGVAWVSCSSQSQTSSLQVTVTTQKASYVLRETVDVYGNVTYNGQPVNEGLVGIQIKDPRGNHVIRTVRSGTVVPGEWGIVILSVTPCDSLGNPKDQFERGKWAYFKVTVKNNYPVSRTVLTTFNVYDSTLIPLGIGSAESTVATGGTTNLMQSVWIEKWASPGNAPVYANVYSDWPENGGYPYASEKTANFTIIESIYEEPPTNPIPEQPVQNGSYQIQFRLSPEPRPGSHIVSVSAMYKGYKATATTTFQVEDILAPPRASFIAKPPTTGPNSTITLDGSFSSAEGFNDSITSYSWNFGDAQQATGSIVTHSYPNVGNYTVTLNVTDSEGFWNTTSKTVRVDIIRDVAVTDMQSLDEVYNNWLTTITVTVKNKGTTMETFNVTTYYNSSIIAVKTVTNLDVTREATVTFTWNTTNIPPLTNYTISAKASILPNEANTTNNDLTYGIVKVRKLGDVVFDRAIDIADVVSVTAVYGITASHPKWKPLADLKPDGQIDIADVVVVAAIYGTTY